MTKIFNSNSEGEFYNDSDDAPVDNSEDDSQWNFNQVCSLSAHFNF